MSNEKEHKLQKVNAKVPKSVKTLVKKNNNLYPIFKKNLFNINIKLEC